jgi:Ca2+/H+ antiporter
MHTCRDGKSNYLEGLMLIALYIVLGLACEYFVPSPDIN